MYKIILTKTEIINLITLLSGIIEDYPNKRVINLYRKINKGYKRLK